ncbi:hypothetical protein [Bernardetia sp.]|uniref:hypothetical protein n=1 Tax=Bernardetia sp. TaxID=1937974 RepID=UPI0025B8E992|nr:hypothetical protein [Bernardetia sp.]
MFYTSKKESWEKALEIAEKNERNHHIEPTIKWLKSKGCDKVFYISFSHYDVLLTKNWGKGRSSEETIIFGFSKVMMAKGVLQGITDIESNNTLLEDDKDFIKLKTKCHREINRLIIEIKTETEHYSHITKINQYDEFEKILDGIVDNLV